MAQRPGVQVCSLVLGIAAMVGWCFIVYKFRQDNKYVDWFPELGSLLLFSILAIATFLWLNVAKATDFDLRLVVLIFGGGLGLIVFIHSLSLLYFWRNDTIFGGLSAWQGENAWHLWTCVYLQFTALILMFGSFNLARADIRTNAVLRRIMYGYDALVQALLVLEILLVANLLFYWLVPFTFNWTKSRGAYALSDASKNLISNLKKDVNVVVLMSPNDPVYRDLHTTLDNCQAISSKFKVEYISPDADQVKYSRLEKQFPPLRSDNPMTPAGRGVLIVSGPLPLPDEDDAKSPYVFVAATKFTEEDFAEVRKGGKPKKSFKGEGEIIREVSFLVQGKKRKVYVLQGHGEPDINSEIPTIRPDYQTDLYKLGFSELVGKLNKDNYEVVGLSFGIELPAAKDQRVPIEYARDDSGDRKKRVPKECDTLIVLPTPVQAAFPIDAVDAIELLHGTAAHAARWSRSSMSSPMTNGAT